MKLRLHPLFFVALFAYTLLGGIKWYLVAFLAVLIHEFSHAAVARLAGANGITVTLAPYGAMMTATGEIPRFGAVLIAGPLSNLTVASVALAACWLVPELYGVLKGFVRANAMIATVNLLPAYPLDGGRLCRLSIGGKGVRVLTSLCTLLVALAAGLGGALTYNLSLLLFGAFMLSYFLAFCLNKPTRARLDDPLYTLAKTDEEGVFLPAVVGKKGERIRLSSREITALCLRFSPDTTIKNVLSCRERGVRYK